MAQLVGNSLDFNGSARALNLPAPLTPTEPVRLQDLNSAVEGLGWKDSARVGTQGNLSLSAPGATVDGVAMAGGDRVLVRNQTAPAENGIYVWNGASVALTRALDASTSDELEQAVLTIEEGTDAGLTFRQTQVNFVLGTGSVLFTSFGNSAPAASSSTPGIAALATQSEVDAGLVANKIITPALLAAWVNRKLKFSATIGDGTATQYDVVHNLGTRDVMVEVYQNASPWGTILVDAARFDANTARINFAVAPAVNAYRVVVLG